MSKGFSLLELLVVIGVIGMLAALSLPNFMSARQRARDAQRKSDLIQIQKALELYKLDQISPSFIPNDNFNFPKTGQRWVNDNDNSIVYMNKVPGDPNLPYFYSVDNGSLTYKLQACIENKADPGAQDCQDGYDCSSLNTTKCYLVEQP